MMIWKLALLAFCALVAVAIATAKTTLYPESHRAIKLASIAYGVDRGEMTRVASCETGGTFNPRSIGPPTKYGRARGLFQFLRSTWLRTPFAEFSVYDPVANSLAAAWLVRHDKGWSEWSCKP